MKYQQNYIRAFDKLIDKMNESGKAPQTWKTGQDVFDWWIADVRKNSGADERQISFF